MTGVPEPSAASDIERLLVAMRPRLHRYCARMVGSVIDGEDVLQDALIKAVEARASAGAIGNPEGWLFRIAHNTALDFLRLCVCVCVGVQPARGQGRAASWPHAVAGDRRRAGRHAATAIVGR
jgi:hypothetical protein